jgi:hypothetical protein
MKNFKSLHEGLITKAAATVMAIKFANFIRKPFTDWKAYKLGIIDEKGNLLKKPTTKEEKESHDFLINIIRKIKKVIVKYVGDSKILGFLLAAYLLKAERFDPLNVEQEITENLSDKELEIFEQCLEILYNDLESLK